MADIKRAENPDGSDRCQRTRTFGQCPNKKAPGQDYCQACQRPQNHLKSKRLNYELIRTGLQNDLTTKSGSENIKSLREEIGILRILIERIINSCSDDDELLIKSPQIAEMLTKVEKLVRSCHYIEDQMGNLLDKTAVLRFGTLVVDLLAEEIDDVVLLEKISGKLLKLLSEPPTDGN